MKQIHTQAYPVLPVLRFALTIIHGCSRAAKNGEGLAGIMSDVRWTGREVDVG